MEIESYKNRRADQSQQALARSLLACLTREQAIRACHRNGWDGVLTVLLRPDVWS